MFTMEEVAYGLSLLFPTWFTIWLDNERYGDMTYPTLEEAQTVCNGLQEVYDRFCWAVEFSIKERDRLEYMALAFELDHKLIGVRYH
jgi:hypothetical protein